MKLWSKLATWIINSKQPFKKGEKTKDADAAEVQRIEIQTTVKRRAREFEEAALFLTLLDACAVLKRHPSSINGACGNGNGSSL